MLAFIVPKPDVQPDLSAVADAAAKNLARFKQPRELILLDELPRDTMGKAEESMAPRRTVPVVMMNPFIAKEATATRMRCG